MNFTSIIKQIEKSDPEVYERLSTRRGALKSFGSKVALAALPLALGSLFKKAYGKTSSASAVIGALNLALEMEYFQYNYYHTANNLPDLIPPSTAFPTGSEKNGFITIEAQEKAHIILLSGVVTAMGGTPFTPKNYVAGIANPYYIPNGTYDFTGGSCGCGIYYDVFNDYPTFLMMAQVFEDTAVHAYKGQMTNLLGDSGVLTQAFQIQATEARHAAHARTLRRLPPINAFALDVPAPWITNNIPPIAALQPYYLGEDVTQQLYATDILNIPDVYGSAGTVPKISATAAFDEGMDSGTIISLIQPFLIP